jgi:hypothetical protein
MRLTTRIDWYRFARRTLGLGRAEARAYANARFLEETNRRALAVRRAA